MYDQCYLAQGGIFFVKNLDQSFFEVCNYLFAKLSLDETKLYIFFRRIEDLLTGDVYVLEYTLPPKTKKRGHNRRMPNKAEEMEENLLPLSDLTEREKLIRLCAQKLHEDMFFGTVALIDHTEEKDIVRCVAISDLKCLPMAVAAELPIKDIVRYGDFFQRCNVWKSRLTTMFDRTAGKGRTKA